MIAEIEALDASCIEKLASGELLAVRWKQFITEELAETLKEGILTKGFDKYLNASSIGRIGLAFYETENDPVRIHEYFDDAAKNIRELRGRCAPYLSPMDMLRCTLDEVWPAGAKLETLYGRKMYVGLSRVVEPGVPMLAHHDIFSKDAPDSFEARSLRAQLTANVYLSMPLEGGALQIWDTEISVEEFDTMRGGSYGIDPALLGKPTVEVKPEAGDLLLFNSNCMHAVSPSLDATRLSLSCFVGYRGSASPLSFWS
ncbi:2OG-Fe(II) oxygenase [Stenotrophomonas sp. ISL-67]|uniref:2OG-Fe(II) oxygenase n=1 Tax=Stenotrophomonas sp. ISL-67 TaxID=2819171 RepID=UPI001BE5FB87|nr:2OG-Fe(II) oxygenase [Stenotrophomonas sp. ISL-67]